MLERERQVGTGQTGHNSGVVHAGIYYAPGSLKARLCAEGARELYEFCERHEVAHERCGKLIVARTRAELPGLDELERRGRANGVTGLRRLGSSELERVEPHCRGVAALLSPATGIADFGAVAAALAAEASARGAQVSTGAGVQGIAIGNRRIELRHAAGTTSARFAVFCTGASSDRLATMAGAPADPRIVPFHGAYLRLRADRRSLVRSLIYPVPDPSLPFLGVHLTRNTAGEVLVGPSALLAPAYSSVSWPGTWRMAARFWRTGLTEAGHAASRRLFVRAAARYVPALLPEDVEPAFVGVRAQALGRDGRLVDDFVMHPTERALHVRNAPSPAATSSLALARMIADSVEAAID